MIRHLLAVGAVAVAIGLAPAAGAAFQVADDEEGANGLLDLAAIVLRPADLADEGYAVAASESRTLSGYAEFLNAIGTDVDDLAESLADAGWRQWYWITLALPSEDDPDNYGRSVNVYLAAYGDEEGAEIGYELLTEAHEAFGYEETSGGDEVGEETVFTRRSAVADDSGSPFAELSIVFRHDAIVAEIGILDFSGDAPPASEAVQLGDALVARIEAVQEDGAPGFGPAVLRLDGAAVTTDSDWYRRLGDETGRAYSESNAEFEADDDLFADSDQSDIYWFFQTVTPKDEDDPPYYYLVNLFRFAAEGGAEAFVEQTVADFLDDTPDAFSDAEGLDDAGSFGDQSAAISFAFERADGIDVGAIRYLVRVEDRAAVLELSGDPAPPLAAIETLAERQADCLEAGACAAWAPVPADLGDEGSEDGEDGNGWEVEIRLREVDDSGVSGTATLAADGDETVATIELRNGEDGMLAVVQGGTCDELDPRPLSDFAEFDHGEATLVIPLTLEDLLDGHAIAVYAGEDDLDELPVACEDMSVTAG